MGFRSFGPRLIYFAFRDFTPWLTGSTVLRPKYNWISLWETQVRKKSDHAGRQEVKRVPIQGHLPWPLLVFLISSFLDGIAHFQDGTFSFRQLWNLAYGPIQKNVSLTPSWWSEIVLTSHYVSLIWNYTKPKTAKLKKDEWVRKWGDSCYYCSQ